MVGDFDTCRLWHLSALLLILNITTFRLVSSVDPEQPALQKLVYHWLHWGANWGQSSHPSAPHPRDSTAQTSSSAGALPEPPAPYVAGAATRNASFAARMSYPSVMMHRAEVDLISSYLTSQDVYVEFGSGGSSVAFTTLVKRAYSIDHDCRISSALRNVMSENGIHPAEGETKFLCVDIHPGFRGWGTISPFEPGNYQQFKEYVDLIEAIPEKRFDKVLIDGRALTCNCDCVLPRYELSKGLACALRVLPYLHDNSLVFIHDFYTRLDHYSQVLQYYIEVARILAQSNNDPTQGPIDEPQGLIVLRRKPDLVLPLSTSDIDATYERIDWRSPFPDPITSVFRRTAYTTALFFDWGRWKRAYNPSHLLSFVVHDLLVLAAVYGIVSFVVQNYRMYRRDNSTALKASKRLRDRSPHSGSPETLSTTSRPNSNIKFMETEGMKAANARRKRASAVALKV
ncbi:hypothetical protein FGB62_113g14 [Gracilaria domingensis]|nr:hypothetical protein FGB62_113g14 [Gracilaria domingensis]